MTVQNSAVQAFLLITPENQGAPVCQRLRASPPVVWAAQAYGPHPVIAYASAACQDGLSEYVESLRNDPAVRAIDARMCKHIPGDEELSPLELIGPELAVLLINVNYEIEKERIVSYRLRENCRVKLARAMWGPADIIALVEAPDHESMRNLICDEIKVMKGVATNTTLYCYPGSC